VHFYFISENNLQACPHVKVSIGKHEISAILDCGTQTLLITEELHNKLISNGVERLEMPIQNAVFSALSGTVPEEPRKRRCLK
jgi:hypothetical protein